MMGGVRRQGTSGVAMKETIQATAQLTAEAGEIGLALLGVASGHQLIELCGLEVQIESRMASCDKLQLPQMMHCCRPNKASNFPFDFSSCENRDRSSHGGMTCDR